MMETSGFSANVRRVSATSPGYSVVYVQLYFQTVYYGAFSVLVRIPADL